MRETTTYGEPAFRRVFGDWCSPDFDPRTYGSPKLSDLLEKTGRFETRKAQGRNLEVRRLD